MNAKIRELTLRLSDVESDSPSSPEVNALRIEILRLGAQAWLEDMKQAGLIRAASAGA